jgi:hypothetical protein
MDEAYETFLKDFRRVAVFRFCEKFLISHDAGAIVQANKNGISISIDTPVPHDAVANAIDARAVITLLIENFARRIQPGMFGSIE